ncbi:hypothetical protein CCHL11_05808 [Colletotrichum chlorophyti]|uniref:Uncharacterized protein n=1 Tax=Colletotrichum chlorophyti TaxID=708187 RepID=A0A1Q8RMK2_9PEZI|nr:hypothetical protein CCHL11_05808 [Colletotrichum chlorophyti]
MHAFTTIAAALLLAGVQAAPVVETRQVIYGCYFSGDGIVDRYISVGHDEDVPGQSGKVYHLDCGTTSSPRVGEIFAKCTVDDKEPFGITANASDKNGINCPIA